jgi:hypothetical protein
MIAGLPAWLGLAMAARAQPTQTDVAPARVTSDSPEFCAQLADQLREEVRARGAALVPEEVHMLEEEGLKLCSEGHLRPGILRLRRALQILKEE